MGRGLIFWYQIYLNVLVFHYYNNIIFTYSIVSVTIFSNGFFQESNFHSLVSLFKLVIVDKIVYSRIHEI